jgi:hypothetical protein
VATAVQSVDGTNIVTIGKTRVPISAVTAVSNTI